MAFEQWMQIITVVASLIGSGFLGYFAKYYLDKKQQFTTKNAEFKRTAYSEVIDLLMQVMSQNKLGALSDKELVKRLNSAYGQCILYASPEVINAFGDAMQYLFTSDKQDAKITMTNLTKIFKYMREDIGLSNEGLGENGEKLMRVRLNDYAETMN
jgi:hypothetical protein